MHFKGLHISVNTKSSAVGKSDEIVVVAIRKAAPQFPRRSEDAGKLLRKLPCRFSHDLVSYAVCGYSREIMLYVVCVLHSLIIQEAYDLQLEELLGVLRFLGVAC